MLLITGSIEQSRSKLTEVVYEGETREANEKSEVAANVRHHVRQPV